MKSFEALISHQHWSECKLAIQAAETAGKQLQKRQTEPHRANRMVHSKGTIDFVSDVDLHCEELICSHLQHSGFAILAEERGGLGELHTKWIIDPLDGTTNYLHGFPAYAVSIALEIENKLVLGVIHNPVLSETFVALDTAGAWLNQKRIFCSATKDLTCSLLATGFPYDRHTNADHYLPLFKHFLTRCRGVRRAGSAALDLAHVACGRLDGFWEFKLKSWDVAAGALLIREAGGVVSDVSGKPLLLNQPNPLAASPAIHAQMLSICSSTKERDTH